MVTLQEGKRVDHYCWYRDSSSLDYMQKYRSDAWSRRIYQNHLHEVGESTHIDGSVSTCIELTRGVWSVGNNKVSFWVVTGPVKDTLSAKWPFDFAWTGWNPPEFILLSGEPKVLNLDFLAPDSAIELLMDGSSRNWYSERMHARQVRIHDTERQGAYVKRW